MAAHVEHPLPLIQEAIEGFRAPNRFDEGESVVACLRNMRGQLVFLPAYVIGVDRYSVRLRSTDNVVRYSLMQYDVLKLAAVESSASL